MGRWSAGVRRMVQSLRVKAPPGPGRPARTSMAMLRDPLRFFADNAKRYGRTYRVWFGPVPIYVFCDPADVERVLVTESSRTRKDASTRELRVALGGGLLVSEGETWKRSRKLAAPRLSRRNVEAYAEDMIAESEAFAAKLADGESRDMHADMMALTLRIVVKTLFGLEYGDASEGREVSRAIDEIIGAFTDSWYGAVRVLIGEAVPLPRSLRDARGRLNGIIEGLIERRRREGVEGDDLLSRLMKAQDDDGSGLSATQLRDEAITMFVAGHETTALTLSYAWWLLAKNPETFARVREELDGVLGGRAARSLTAADLPSLRYIDAVISESMRLYPPAWAIGREVTQDLEIGGYTVPRGAQIFLIQWAVHRDPQLYPDPEAFRPERWLEGPKPARGAYFPFGGGPRVCIGNHFARMEAVLSLAAMAATVDYEPIHDELPPFNTVVTLRPTGGIPARVRRR